MSNQRLTARFYANGLPISRKLLKTPKMKRLENKKKPNYKGFVLHIREWCRLGISYGLKDLINLTVRYNCPIPIEIKEKK